MADDLSGLTTVLLADTASLENDFAPTGYLEAGVWKLSLTANSVITGFSGGSEGRFLIIENTSAFALSITAEDTRSLEANRIEEGSAIEVASESETTFIYSEDSSRWKASSDLSGSSAVLNIGYLMAKIFG